MGLLFNIFFFKIVANTELALVFFPILSTLYVNIFYPHKNSVKFLLSHYNIEATKGQRVQVTVLVRVGVTQLSCIQSLCSSPLSHIYSSSLLCFFLLVVQLLSHVQLFAALWAVAHQAPPSMRFPRQEYWSGFLVPSSGDLSDTGFKPSSPTLQSVSCTAGRFLYQLSYQGSPTDFPYFIYSLISSFLPSTNVLHTVSNLN